MERLKCIENLPSEKFTKKQFSKISNALEKKDEMIRLVTYNMLFYLYDHNLDNENRWPNRLPRIVELIHEMRPDIINTQELYPTQVQEIVNLIGDDFSFFLGRKIKMEKATAFFIVQIVLSFYQVKWAFSRSYACAYRFFNQLIN